MSINKLQNNGFTECCCVASVVSNSVRPHRRQPTRLPRPWDSPGKNTGVGCHFLLQCMKVKRESEVAQSCPTLATPWTAAYQAPPSTGFSRQEYWSLILNGYFIYNCLTYTFLPICLILQISCCSVAQPCPTLCNHMDYSTPGFPIHHYLPKLAQTQVQ